MSILFLGKTYYNKVYKQPQYVWMPHVVLYIDASVDQCKELIKKRNNVSTYIIETVILQH